MANSPIISGGGVVLKVPPRVWEILSGVRGLKGKSKEIMAKHGKVIKSRTKSLYGNAKFTGRLQNAITVRFEVAGDIYVLYVTAKDTGNSPTPREDFLQRELGGPIAAQVKKNLAFPMPEYAKRLKRRPFAVIDNPGKFGFKRVFSRNNILLGVTQRDKLKGVLVFRKAVTQKGTFFATKAIREQKPKIVNDLMKMVKDAGWFS